MHARTVAAALVCLTLTALLPAPATAAPASGWTAPWQLESAVITVSALHVELLPGGGAVALWVATPSTTSFVACSRYFEGSGWSQPTYTRLNGDASSLSFDVNAAGDGVATWLDWTTGPNAFSSFFHADGGLMPPVPVYETQGNTQPSVSSTIDETGMATILFAEWNGSANNPLFVRGSAATGVWSAPAPLPLDNGSFVLDHPMAVRANATGAVFAVWEQANATSNHLYGTTFAAGAWTALEQMDTNAFGVFSEVQLEVMADGRAAAAWSENNATGIFAPVVSSYLPASGWQPDGTPLPLAYDMGTGGYDLACADSGRCAAAWIDASATQSYVAFAVSNDGGASFGPASQVDPSLSGGANQAALSLTPQGDGVLAWAQSGAPPLGTPPHASTYAAAITPAGALGTTQRLDQNDGQNAIAVFAGAKSDGTHLVAWLDSASLKVSAWATLLRPADTASPTLRVTAPLANAIINGSSTVVQGISEPGASVSVNGALALVRADGSFAIRVPLPQGANILRVTAWDSAGNNVTALVDITVVDPSTALAGQLDAANLTIVYLTENITLLEENETELRTEFAILVQHLDDLSASWNATRNDFFASQNASSILVARAEANATLAHEATHVLQQRLDGTQSDLNTTKADLASAHTSAAAAQSASSNAMLVGVLGALAGIAGLVMAIRNPGRASGSATARQTPKRDFGDRTKAGLDTAGGASQFSSGPRQTTSQDGSFSRPLAGQREGAEPGSIDVSAESESEEEEEEEEDDETRSVSKDHATGLATGKRGGDGQGGALYNPPAVGRGPRQSTSVDGSFAPNEPTDAKYGAVSGAHRYDEFSKATGRSAAAPRDSATGQATGKRVHEPTQEYLPGDSAVFNDQVVARDSATGQASGKREAAAPRDAASGQATGKRQATGDLDGDGAAERSLESPRDSASGQATGKRSSMAGEYLRDAASGQASGLQAQAPSGTHHDVKAPRDSATGQASGRFSSEIQSPRDVASGQASGKMASHEVQAPRDTATGQASGKMATHEVKAPRDAASGQASGMAINEQGVAEPPPKKKPVK